MSVQSGAGTVIGIVAGQPATFDATGYAALTYAAIGEITDGGTHGRVYNSIQHKPLATRGTQKFKGSFDEGQKVMQLAIDRSDPGQVVAKAALLSDNNYSFRVVYPDGSKDYFQAKVLSFPTTNSNTDALIVGTLTLDITTSSSGVGIVEAAS